MRGAEGEQREMYQEDIQKRKHCDHGDNQSDATINQEVPTAMRS